MSDSTARRKFTGFKISRLPAESPTYTFALLRQRRLVGLSFFYMPEFCDVALPVPLVMAFTYRIDNGSLPIVVGLHDRAPTVKAKNVLSVLDAEPVLDPQLMKLGTWIADYYLAPIGEVFRTMLPLGAEFKRLIGYTITDAGRTALYEAGMSGSSARSRRTPDDQLAEVRVLDHLNARDEMISAESLRATTQATKKTLDGMVRKKWIQREDLSGARDATRMVKIAVLNGIEDGKKLNGNQRTLLDTLAAAGGTIPIKTLLSLEVPRSTLATLVRRNLVEIREERAAFAISSVAPRKSFEFQLNDAQRKALQNVQKRVNTR